MFDVGFTEIIVILGIALVVLGPEKLPKVAAELGRWLGRARAMARQFKAQLDEEVIKADTQWSKPNKPPDQPPPWSGEAPPEAKEAGTTAGVAAESGEAAPASAGTPAQPAPSPPDQPQEAAGGSASQQATAEAGEPAPAEAAADTAAPPPASPQADAKTGS